MFKLLNLLLFFGLTPFFLSAQIKIEKVSQDSLYIWNSDAFYIYEFYLLPLEEDKIVQVEVKSKGEGTVIKSGLGNEKIDSEVFKVQHCVDGKRRIQVFFKHIPGYKKEDEVEISLSTDTDTTQIKFHYQLKKEEVKKIKMFQNRFTEYLIVDLDYGSIKEITLFDKTRQFSEQVKTRSRFLDLSFLQKGEYILEINNEEYIIHKM